MSSIGLGAQGCSRGEFKSIALSVDAVADDSKSIAPRGGTVTDDSKSLASSPPHCHAGFEVDRPARRRRREGVRSRFAPSRRAVEEVRSPSSPAAAPAWTHSRR